MRRNLAAALAAGALLAAPGSAPAAVDCTGPARAAQPGTAAWHLREAQNAFCATQRTLDLAANPLTHTASLLAQTVRPGVAMDPLREPRRHDGKRFRFTETVVDGRSAFLFRPLAQRHAPPYPGVVVMHGGAANHEMYLWASEGLAEAGYAVISVNLDDRLSDAHLEATASALDHLARQPDVDGERIGLAGHSAGGVAVSRLGQTDPRVRAVVSWDRAQSRALPTDVPLRTPALFVAADYNCQQVPVCLPAPYRTPPDPLGPGNKDEDFRRLRAAGVDAMKVTLRAATHLDFTEWAPLNASRHGAVTTQYFTRAWLDRYLRNDPAGTARLTAARFDASADVHNISLGRFDPLTARNVPARIAGQRVADRLSFHFRSGYHLEGGALRCERMPCQR